MTDNEIIKAFKDFLIEQVDGYTDHIETGGERYEFIEKELELLKETDNLINRLQAKVIKEQNKNSKLRNERNRLQAEVERLKSDVSVSRDAYMSMKDRYEYEKEKVEKAKQKCIDIGKALKNAKAEAYKEFTERLKEKSKQGKGYLGNVYHSVDVAEIDNLLKEMEREQ